MITEEEMMVALINKKTAIRKEFDAFTSQRRLVNGGIVNGDGNKADFPYPRDGWTIKKRVLWVNFYDNGEAYYHTTKKQAEEEANNGYRKLGVAVRVEIDV